MDEGSRLKPFVHARWPSAKKETIALIWEWHDFLRNGCGFETSDEAREALRGEHHLFFQESSNELVPSALSESVFRAIEEQELPREWFGDQLSYAHAFYGPIRFEDARGLKQFVRNWVSPHAYLIAKLADVAHGWQRKLVDELATGFFIVDALRHLKEDLRRDHLFIPLDELKQAGVSVEQLKEGDIDAGVRRLLWKQAIRARDAFAQGQPLLRDLERRYRRDFKRNWLTGLEFIHAMERRKYDLWSQPLELSRIQKFQINVLTFIGKGAGQVRGGR